MHKNCQSIHGIKAFVDFQPASDSHVGISWLLQVYTRHTQIYSQRRALTNCGRRILFNNWISRHQSGIMAELSSQYILLSWCPHSFLSSQDCHYLMPTRHLGGHGPVLLIMCRRHDILTCNSGSADRAWPAELLFCIPCSTNYKHWDSTQLRSAQEGGVKNN